MTKSTKQATKRITDYFAATPVASASLPLNPVTMPTAKKVRNEVCVWWQPLLQNVHTKCQTRFKELRWKELDADGNITAHMLETGWWVINNFLNQMTVKSLFESRTLAPLLERNYAMFGSLCDQAGSY
ncbi:hypothetical protein BC830DRAFT_1078198 [Chytriomyces sp. MP71]|nr:hypothetical protein BC830DRAFT_1078198 [Chytriomyces sp. MP71]